MKYIGHIAVAAFAALTLFACSGPSDPDCSGDGVITSESHWANCGENGATNASTNNDATDAGFNMGANGGNATTNNGQTGNNTVSDAGSNYDAGDTGTDAGTDAGTLESCYAYRWNDTERAFDTARCTDTGAGTFNCSCFSDAETMSIAITCDQALSECGATFQEVEGCTMTDSAGCTVATDGGWDCTCLDAQDTIASDAERCDIAYWSSCYSDNFCESSLTDGTARCEPSLDTDYSATGYTCACYQDGVEVKPPALQSGASCTDDASAYCSDI